MSYIAKHFELLLSRFFLFNKYDREAGDDKYGPIASLDHNIIYHLQVQYLTPGAFSPVMLIAVLVCHEMLIHELK